MALRAPLVWCQVLCAAVAVNEPDGVEVVHEAAGHLLQPAQHLLSLAPGPGQQSLVVRGYGYCAHSRHVGDV